MPVRLQKADGIWRRLFLRFPSWNISACWSKDMLYIARPLQVSAHLSCVIVLLSFVFLHHAGKAAGVRRRPRNVLRLRDGRCPATHRQTTRAAFLRSLRLPPHTRTKSLARLFRRCKALKKKKKKRQSPGFGSGKFWRAGVGQVVRLVFQGKLAVFQGPVGAGWHLPAVTCLVG